MTKAWDTEGTVRGWSPCFFRDFNDWELEILELFLIFLGGKEVIGGRYDTLILKEYKNGLFQ